MMSGDPQILGQVAHAETTSPVPDTLSQQVCLAAALAHDPQENLNKRGFPGAIGTEEPKDLSPFDGEGNLAKRIEGPTEDPVPIHLAQIRHFDRG